MCYVPVKNKKNEERQGYHLNMLLSFCHHSRVLLALVTILAQSLLTLVGSHLVTLLFLSVWHNLKFFINY